MQTLEEAIKMANEEVETYSPINATSDEGYTYVDGYERYDEYTETQEIVVLDRDVGDISEQISIKGESLSQYILFKINRYYDGIDLTEKKIRIHYELSDGAGSEDDAINVRYNDTDIKFGWAIPEYATRNAGTIKVFIWVYGTAPNGEDYILKTKTLDYEILDSQNIGEGIVQPDENWYTSFVRQITVYVEQAKASENKAKQSETNAKASETKTLEYKNSVEQTVGNFNTTVEQSLVQINTAKSDALTSISTAKDEANTSIQNTKASAITQIQTEATTQKNAIVQEGTKQVGLVKAAGEEVTESVDQIWKNELYSRHRATGIMLEVNGTGEVEIQDGTNSKMEIELDGKTEQVETTGDQLFDASKLPGITKGGASVTYNGDGSFTISGSGNMTEELNYQYNYSHEETMKLLKSGNLNIKIGKVIFPYVYIQLRNSQNSIIVELNSQNSEEKTVEITEEMLGNDGINMRIGFYAGIGKTITPCTIKPMVYQDGDGTWEPYTGGQPAPSPDYPQVIKGVGGMGYFDGEWRKGVYQSSNGAWQAAGNGICSQNPIKAKAGDNVTLKYPDEATLVILAYKSDGTYLGNNAAQNANEVSYTLPTDTTYVHIDVQMAQGVSITPSTAKYCTVTINGEYQTGVEVHGAQLLNAEYEESFTLNKRFGNLQIFPGTYTISVDKIISSDTDSNYSAIYVYGDSTSDVILAWNVERGVKQSRQFTVPNGKIAKIVYAYSSDSYDNSQGDTATYYGLMLNEGSTALPWEPYHHTAISIPLTSPLYSGDKICYVKPGESYVDADGITVVADRILYGCYRENATVVFDGSEDEGWVYSESSMQIYTTNTQYNIKNESLPAGIVKSDNFISGSVSDRNSGKKEIVYQGNGTVGFLGISSTIFTSLETAKTWLSTHPTTVLYKLAQPYFEPFVDQTEIYNLFTIDSYTRVASKEKETIPDLKVEYITDTKKYIDKKVSEAITQAITIAQA